MSRKSRSLLAQVDALIHGSRARAYGPVKKNWGRTVAIFGAITGRKLSVREALLLMVAAKLAREFNRPKRDNIRDAIGYLVLYDEVKGGAK